MEEEVEMGFPMLLKKIFVLKTCSGMRLNQSRLNIQLVKACREICWEEILEHVQRYP